ncbi:hypothetical protein [Hoylesella timonensis]|uniref:Uncharacterized protein n=3 Tax=Hoylesella timonensis TaxID=386414 RepID=D1VZJ8_9BACT|nr:hypothetical protein [Hoylesella timonensis]EFA97448.1 hypothetical protein HMPREF9019_2030 [Hoylesella timonensis CRIS 5C-B1]KGI22314.1 hypothetical protein HMPREF9304_05035 [Hoylesella timonensis S9-PR14]PMC09460.1 hypothetical protein CJ232_08005 [Hoylesella timonensis]
MKKKYIAPVCHIIPIEIESLLTVVSGQNSDIKDYQHVDFDPGKSGDPNASDNQDYGDYEN